MSEAEMIARALGGKRSGSGWLCRCPAHEDHDPSFSVADGRDGRLLLTCFTGCTFEAILDALRRRGVLVRRLPSDVPYPKPQPSAPDPHKAKMAERARRIWGETITAAGSPTEEYLHGRGYMDDVPDALRFHPRVLYRETNTHLPAMIAAVTLPGGTVGAIIRTYLTATRPVRKAPLAKNKLSLGEHRPGAVRLAPAGPVLAVCEGIETGLAIMQATGLPVWAAGGTRFLEAMVLPPLPLAAQVIIGADGDAPGEQAAMAAAQLWTAEGRRVRIARPPAGYDFADVMEGKVPGALADAGGLHG